jgi:hypothetical protein
LLLVPWKQELRPTLPDSVEKQNCEAAYLLVVRSGSQ